MASGINSRRASLLIAGIVGLGVFAVATIGDVIAISSAGSRAWVLADHLALGAFAAAIVLAYDRRRRGDLHEKLSSIHEINHHIRNQLEVIEYSAWATHDQQHVARIHESVKRIDWALREILGRQEDEEEGEAPPPFPPESVPAEGVQPVAGDCKKKAEA